MHQRRDPPVSRILVVAEQRKRREIISAVRFIVYLLMNKKIRILRSVDYSDRRSVERGMQSPFRGGSSTHADHKQQTRNHKTSQQKTVFTTVLIQNNSALKIIIINVRL